MAAISILSTACASDDILTPIEDPENPTDSITLEFTMLTRNADSAIAGRSEIPVPPDPEAGFGAENFLDLDNLSFLLFDGDQKMLRTFSPEINVEQTSSPYIKYRVRTFLHDNYFLKSTEDEISFTIVVLGNYANLNPDKFNYYIGCDLKDIFDSSKVGTFSCPVSNNTGNTWIPTIVPMGDQGKGQIPMAGMQTFTVRMNDLRNSTPDNPYKLSEGSLGKCINMLRGLAKIEIIDKILSEDDNDSYYIEKVELVGHTSRGSILPTFNQWESGLETSYVTAPSVPDVAEYRGASPVSGLNIASNDNEALINFFYDTEATLSRGDGGKVFSCYLTEYDPAMTGTVPGMWMRLTVKSRLSGKLMQFRIEAASYSDGLPGDRIQILRNNIYRYVVSGVNEIDLDVQPFANLEVSFGFGLLRDARGDLMVLPDKNGNYPEYFINFANTHGYPKAEDEYGNPSDDLIVLQDGDYYAIVVGENEEMSKATIWVKDREGCHVLSNFGSEDTSIACSARRVESFYNNNESEKFYKDKFGYRRVYHFNNHNSIVRHPKLDCLLFCIIENFQEDGEKRRYYEVESWDDASKTGWIVTKDDAGNETGFREITSEGTLGKTVAL